MNDFDQRGYLAVASQGRMSSSCLQQEGWKKRKDDQEVGRRAD